MLVNCLLLQSREWLQLKVLEVHPELTKLGASLKEANELQRAHDDVLLQLQVQCTYCQWQTVYSKGLR
jgi:hypothetical protein